MFKSWLRHHRQKSRSARRQQENRARFQLEPLEGRQLLATFVVSNTSNSGTSSLRWAINQSNATTGPNTIDFMIPGVQGPQTINLLSALPAITKPVTINGLTQSAQVVLSGAHAGKGAIGLDLTSTAAGSTLEGLVIDAFSGGGVLVNGGSGDTITQDVIGKTGAADTGGGNGNFGVELENQATNVTISNDVISGNSVYGVEIVGSGTQFNTVSGDMIGTDSTGTRALTNGTAGVFVAQTASNNTIGGTSTDSRDVISGNQSYGVELSNTKGNVVEGDFIGTNAAGTNALGNGVAGVALLNGASNNTIGGMVSIVKHAIVANDVISGNKSAGVEIIGASNNVVEGDFIGTDVTGSVAVGSLVGVSLSGAATNNTIGGTINVISGNFAHGVMISGAGTSGNTVDADLIGINAAGTAALPNHADGVLVTGGASNNTVGSTVGLADVISGNGAFGVLIDGTGTAHNQVVGDFIGTDALGDLPLGNGYGVEVAGGASNNSIGSTVAGAGNVISANLYGAVVISDTGTNATLVVDNFIGVNSGGTSNLGNGGDGVLVQNGAAQTTIGGTVASAANVISANVGAGVEISGSSKTLVEGNFIGTDATGTTVVSTNGQFSLGNTMDGVFIHGGSTATTVGGTVAGALNVISGNSSYGVEVSGTGTTGSLIAGNRIGTDITGKTDQVTMMVQVGVNNSSGFPVPIFDPETFNLGNGAGVAFDLGAAHNTLGGTVAAASNVISGNGGDGVDISGSGTTANLVQGNFIGTDLSGKVARERRARAGLPQSRRGRRDQHLEWRDGQHRRGDYRGGARTSYPPTSGTASRSVAHRTT